MTSIRCVKEWPVRFRRLPAMPGGVAATSVGGGWARFVSDQNLGHGAFLTFEVVDDWRLVVGVHRRSGAEDLQPVCQEKEFAHNADRACCRKPECPQVENSTPEHSTVLSEVRCLERPQFRKTLRKSHMRKHESCKLVSKLQFHLMSPIALQVFGFTPCCLFLNLETPCQAGCQCGEDISGNVPSYDTCVNVVRIWLVIW